MNAGEVLDIEPFLEAFYALRRQGYNLIWFTTGKSVDESVRERFGIGDELTEFGWVDYKDFSGILSCADAFVLLQQENLKNDTRWPNKIGDYLAAGRPVLTNLHGELRELNLVYPSLFITAEWSVKSLESAVIAFYHSMMRGNAADTSRSSASVLPQGGHPPGDVQTTSSRSDESYLPGFENDTVLATIRHRKYIRQIAEEQLSWQRRAEKLEAFYRRLN
jgi:glycosyltransferase involved in cell wall biosynthesis